VLVEEAEDLLGVLHVAGEHPLHPDVVLEEDEGLGVGHVVVEREAPRRGVDVAEVDDHRLVPRGIASERHRHVRRLEEATLGLPRHRQLGDADEPHRHVQAPRERDQEVRVAHAVAPPRRERLLGGERALGLVLEGEAVGLGDEADHLQETRLLGARVADLLPSQGADLRREAQRGLEDQPFGPGLVDPLIGRGAASACGGTPRREDQDDGDGQQLGHHGTPPTTPLGSSSGEV
jgi:hypothetical protein